MRLLYNKERIVKEEIVCKQAFEKIHFSSVLSLCRYKQFEDSTFRKKFGEIWETNVYIMFINCITYLFISKKIRIVFFVDKISILFNQIVYQLEGYNILLTEGAKLEDEDMLAQNILTTIQTTSLNEPKNLPIIIKRVMNVYLGKGKYASPTKEFFCRYITSYSKENFLIKLIEINTRWGFYLYLTLEISNDKIVELTELCNEMNGIKYELFKRNLLLRKFNSYIQYIVNKDLYARYDSG